MEHAGFYVPFVVLKNSVHIFYTVYNGGVTGVNNGGNKTGVNFSISPNGEKSSENHRVTRRPFVIPTLYVRRERGGVFF